MAEIISRGLTSEAAAKLLLEHGLNEIQDTKKFTLIKAFVSQFKNFLVMLLVAAAGVSFFLGETVDGVFIVLIVILNALFGLYQEFKAEKSLEALKNMTITNVRVIRDGKETEIDNRFLVPGDVVYLEEGAKIPADAKLLESRHLEVNEASLTGESMPVEKNTEDEESNRIFLGTVISKGRCWAEVTQTGGATRFGQIAKSLSLIQDGQTPLQMKLEGLTKQIGILGIIASFTVFILSFAGEKSFIESFIFAVSLAVAAVPEGLPAVMTITLAIGVERMARKKAIVRKLNAIEALGAITLLATDKTGTLTTNKMQVKKIWLEGKEYDSAKLPLQTNPVFSKLMLNGILCSTATLVTGENQTSPSILGDTTEGALLLLGNEMGMTPATIKSEWKVDDELPFNADTKRMTVVVSRKKEKFIFSKGAPESILAICDKVLIGSKATKLTTQKTQEIDKEFRKFAKIGLRMLAFSYKEGHDRDLEKSQTFLGFVGIADPAREGVGMAVKKAHDAGIKVVMITGDSELTAEAIGIELGIVEEGQKTMTGKQIDSFSDEELSKLLSSTRIFARTTPEHKYRLVKLFQQQGEVVAVTGDGVNDALALKQADVGVAMGITGTDVAKETADMVITDDNFASLVNAVEEGRNIFNHIKNSVKFLLACNTGEVVYILAAVIFKLPILTPLQILYMNLVTDGLPAISFAFSPQDAEIMKEKPKSDKKVLTSTDFEYIVLVGVLTALVGLAATFIHNETILFTSIILVQHFILIDNWLSHRPLLQNFRKLGNLVFMAAFFLPILLHPILVYVPAMNKVFGTTPMDGGQILFSIAIPAVVLVILEAVKVFRKYGRNNNSQALQGA